MLPRGPFSNATQDYEQVAGSRLLVNLAKSLLTHGLGSPSQGRPQPNNTGLVVNSVLWRRGSGAVDPSVAPLL